MRALTRLLILQYAIENVKWKTFWKKHSIEDHAVSLKDINKLRAAMAKKETEKYKGQLKNCSKKLKTKLQQQFIQIC